MKTTILVSFLALLGIGATLAPLKPDGITPGDPSYVLADFRGIRWGTHLDSAVRDGNKLEFTRAAEVSDKNAYTLKDDELIIGTVSLDKLYYIFNKNGRFTGVLMLGQRSLDEKKQVGEMKYILSYKFGDPELRQVPGGIQYYWLVDDVRITLDDLESQGVFRVEFHSDYERVESKRINMNVDDF